MPTTAAGLPVSAGPKTRLPIADCSTSGPKKSDALPMVTRARPLACACIKVSAISALTRPFRVIAVVGRFSVSGLPKVDPYR